MVKAEWGTKRSCPKCGERFYDLGKDETIVCIECGNQWVSEPVLKSKQPMPFEVAAPAPEKEESTDDDLAAEVPDEDEEPSADDEVDLATGEDDLGVSKSDEDDD